MSVVVNAKNKLLGSSSISETNTLVDRPPVGGGDMLQIVGEPILATSDLELVSTTINIANTTDITIVVFYIMSAPEDIGGTTLVTYDIAFLQDAAILQTITHGPSGANSDPFVDRAIFVLTGLSGSIKFGINIQNYTQTGARRVIVGGLIDKLAWVSTNKVVLTDTHRTQESGVSTN